MIEFNKGIRVSGTDLWLDSTRPRPLGFISHAHADHTARHQLVITTPATWALSKHRFGPKSEVFELDFHVKHQVEDYTIELFPAGHMLGAAQIMIQNGQRIVYTGDLKLRPNFTAGEAEIQKCDTLIIESTFGHPRYRFPDQEESWNRLVEFIESALEDGKIPVLLAYQIGKSQEVLKFLGDRGYTVCLPKQTMQVVKVYESLGIQFKGYEPLSFGNLFGKVILIPPYLSGSRMIKKIIHRRTAFLTGWAMDPEAQNRFRVDELIPISDHASFDDLMEYVEKSSPTQVYTVHGGPELAEHLEKKGVRAEHLAPGVQIGFW